MILSRVVCDIIIRFIDSCSNSIFTKQTEYIQICCLAILNFFLTFMVWRNKLFITDHNVKNKINIITLSVKEASFIVYFVTMIIFRLLIIRNLYFIITTRSVGYSIALSEQEITYHHRVFGSRFPIKRTPTYSALFGKSNVL